MTWFYCAYGVGIFSSHLARAWFVSLSNVEEKNGEKTLLLERKESSANSRLIIFSSHFFFVSSASFSLPRALSLIRTLTTYRVGRNLRTMLFPSSRPRRTPLSTIDSHYETTPTYSSSSYTRWSRSPARSSHLRRTANSASSRRYPYPMGPCTRQEQQQPPPIYSSISPRLSLQTDQIP